MVNPPKVIYTDRDCCNREGTSKINTLFHQWPRITVRLDIWHWMRRIAVGCRSESHPLYSVFMSQLSSCVFEIDREDYRLLQAAKRQELQLAGLSDPSDEAVRKSTSKNELLRHCRRKTRPQVSFCCKWPLGLTIYKIF